MPHAIRNIQSPYSDDTAFWAHFQGCNRTMTMFVMITPSSVWSTKLPTLGFTSLDYDVPLSAHSLTFKMSAALSATVSELNRGDAPNMETATAFVSGIITEQDLLAGKWNGAGVQVWVMNWSDLRMGEFVIQSSVLKTWIDIQSGFKSAIEGLSAVMSTNFGQLTGPVCRHGEFPTACNGPTGTYGGFTVKKTLTVATVTDKTHLVFTRSAEDVSDTWYNNGKILGKTGNNQDLAREMLVATGHGSGHVNVTLRRPFPIAVNAGDTFELWGGCDHTLDGPAGCKFWGNVINRDAEDFIPSLEKAATLPPV